MPRLGLITIAWLLVACAWTGSPGDTTAEPGAAVVIHPVDGDTIEVRVGGQTERVRLIGIDTPESVARDRPVECFGIEAKVRMAELLPAGTKVRLERDIEARDRYGRLLAYVFREVDGTNINLHLVQEGFAESRSFAPNTARQAELDEAEIEAKAAGRGLWPACGSTNIVVGPPPR
ncbi:MAG: thermonuclease family protein [Acidimicrobiales bacterium]